LLYKTIKRMFEDGHLLTFQSIVERITNDEALDSIGGEAFIEQIISNYVVVDKFKEYINSLRSFSLMRQIVALGNKVASDWKKNETTIKDYFATAYEQMEEVITTYNGLAADFKRGKELIEDIEKDINNPKKINSNPNVISTGYEDLDRIIGEGFTKTYMYVLAARPGIGKTTFAINFVERIIRDQSKKVAFFSLENMARKIVEKIVSIKSRTPIWQIEKGKIDDDKKAAVKEALQAVANSNLYIDDSTSNTMADIILKSRQIKGLDILVVDYIGIINPPKEQKKADERHIMIGKISRQFKTLAMNLKIPVIVIAQINRTGDSSKNEGKPPEPANLRDSGSIEQDADVIFLIDRPYKNNEDEVMKNTLKFYIAKNRFGSTTFLHMRQDTATQRIIMLDKDDISKLPRDEGKKSK